MQKAPDPSSLESLNDRILHAEARLIAREASVQLQWQTLMGQARRAVEPQRLLMPLLGTFGGVGGLAFLWKLLGRSPAKASAASTQQRQPSGSGQSPHGAAFEALLMSMIPMLHPMLPARWRNRVSPAMATTALSLGLPMLRQVFSRPADAGPPPVTASHVDLERYAGRWYEIARLPIAVEARCQGQPTATYELRGDAVAVINRCIGKSGDTLVSEGEARVVPDSGGAKLKVTFVPTWLRWLPMVWADYWILDRDEDYTLALVGTPSRKALWLLARTPQISDDALQALIDRARVLGYDVSRLQSSVES